ncbi:CU044_2847 family protein [Saccharothrix sp. ST-888]|uniref:CU044_2847 family protein n=1 Tax=Saccharothrix sp. ST-888 TaxID=1427391 RepID=UPI0005EC1AF4|nr:CU044_2847 family protein [Saccharothrix sp. ST-888]
MLRAFPAPQQQAEAEKEPEPAPMMPLGGLPPGLAGGRPVGRRSEDDQPAEDGEQQRARRVTRLAQGSLRAALRPLVPLLQEVHDTVAEVPDRPDTVSVEFGVRFGSDLKLGIVGGSGESSLQVSATWQLPPRPAADGAAANGAAVPLGSAVPSAR